MGASQSNRQDSMIADGRTELPMLPTQPSLDFRANFLEAALSTTDVNFSSKGQPHIPSGKAGNADPMPRPTRFRERYQGIKRRTPGNHNTPTISSCDSELDERLLIDMLRDYCEYGAGCELPTIGGPYIPKTHASIRTPYPPTFLDLDVDTILEILLYYVACQTDGVFILTLVSTVWRDFVLKSPALWQWVTIDSLLPDSAAKASCCFALSGAYPLQIILRLPMTESQDILPLLRRCRNLFIEVPDYVCSEDAEEATRELMHSAASNACEIHWYRAGDALLTESREPLAYRLYNITAMHLAADGSEHPHYHRYAETRDLRYKDRGDEYHPLVLLKTFHALDIFRNSYYLCHLTISHHSMDPIFLDLDLPVVVLNYLETLTIYGVDFARNGALRPLLQSLRLPALLVVSLSGNSSDILETTYYISLFFTPTRLNLDFTVLEGYISQRAYPSFMPSLTALSLNFISAPWDGEKIIHLSRDAADLVKVLRGLLRLSIFVPPDWFEEMTALQMLPPAEWKRFQVIEVVLGDGKSGVRILYYAWDTNRSIRSISGTNLLASELLGILDIHDSSSIHLRLQADETPISHLQCHRACVKSLHVQIDEDEYHAWMMEDYVSLIETFTQLSELRFITSPVWSSWILLIPMLKPDLIRNLQIFSITVDDKNQMTSCLEYTKETDPSITSISGARHLVMELARLMDVMGSISASTMGLPENRQDFARLICVRVRHADFDYPERLGEVTESLMRNLHEDTITLLFLPSISHYEKLGIPTTMMRHLGALYIETEQSSMVILQSQLEKSRISATFSLRVNSFLFSRFLDELGPILPKDHCLHALSVPDGTHFPLCTMVSLSLHLDKNPTEIEGNDTSEDQVQHIISLLEMVQCIPIVRLYFSGNWVPRTHRISGKAIERPQHSPSMRLSFPSRGTQVISFPSENSIEELNISTEFHWWPSELVYGTFSSLKTLKCTPHVIWSLLSLSLLPSLERIQLYSSRGLGLWATGREIESFDSIAQFLIDNIGVFPNLHVIGLPWFPSWIALLSLMRSMSCNAKTGTELALYLPSYPHPTIQREITAAMRGETASAVIKFPFRTLVPQYCSHGREGTSLASYSFDTRLKYALAVSPVDSALFSLISTEKTANTCPYCWYSGLRCCSEGFNQIASLFCARHSQNQLERITKETFVQVKSTCLHLDATIIPFIPFELSMQPIYQGALTDCLHAPWPHLDDKLSPIDPSRLISLGRGRLPEKPPVSQSPLVRSDVPPTDSNNLPLSASNVKLGLKSGLVGDVVGKGLPKGPRRYRARRDLQRFHLNKAVSDLNVVGSG